MVKVQKKLTFLAGLILLLLVGLSCESSKKESTNNKKLIVDYYVRYLQSDKQVKAEISFSELDSIGKTMPKIMTEVLFQQKALDGKRILNRYRYQLTESASFEDNYTFDYRRNGEGFIKQEIAMSPIEAFEIKNKQVSKTESTILTLKGTAFKENEQLVLLFSDKNNKTATVTFDNLSMDQSLTILPKQIADLTIGKGSLYLVRRQIINDTLDNLVLTGVTEFYSTVEEIEILN